jgi:hypothetical protein
VAEAEESEEELPLAAEVELAAPAAHVADWGKLLTPWPAQRELAKWIVSARQVLLVVVSFLTVSSRMGSSLSWSAASQAVLTQHARPLRSSVLLQMHFTSRLPHEPNEVPTQPVAQVGRPGICAAARVESRAKVRMLACMFAV